MTEKLKSGDRITWIYTHHFNSKSRARRLKTGSYIGLIKHSVRYEGGQLAMVQFDGNKGVSRIPLYKLRKEESNGKSSVS